MLKIITTTASLAISLLCASSHALTPETVPVDNLGNIGEVQSQGTFGAVNYSYRMGKFEVTNAQYADFLNSVAATQVHALFNINMDITISGSSGSFIYTAQSGREQHPVTYVSFWDAARYANWLHNGKPSGPQGLSTTEDGAYFLNGVTNPSNITISREADARWFIPSEDEWYKAAYHKNDGDTGNYFVFPTGSDLLPSTVLPPGGVNSANYGFGVSDTTPVGSYINSNSPYGTFDQGGNVSEWNEAITSSVNRGLRGGSWTTFVNNLQAGNRGGTNPFNEFSNIGFRVATVVPEPCALLLGAMASLLGLAWRKW